jgi:hypothetical protein
LLAVAVLGLALSGCVQASANKVRSAQTSRLCAKHLLTALELLDDSGVTLLVDALREQAAKSLLSL